MRTLYLILTPEDVVEYTREKFGVSTLRELVEVYGEGPLPTKVYELHTALVLARFNLKQTGQHSNILLPLKSGFKNNEAAVKIIESYIDEDNPIDIQLLNADVPLVQKATGKVKGIAFQIKRFNLSGDSTRTLTKYLIEEIADHYAPVNAGLVLLFEGKGSANIQEVNEAFLARGSFPFGNIFYIAIEETVTVGEIWPKMGNTTFSMDEWFETPLQGENP
jgi:hypothetical protein